LCGCCGGEKAQNEKSEELEKSKTLTAKTKSKKKETTDKVVEIESTQIMTRQVASMQSSAATEISSVMIIQDDEPLPISPCNLTSVKPTSTMNDKEEVTSYPSPLAPPKLPTSLHPQTSNGLRIVVVPSLTARPVPWQITLPS
jgi:hypothetical protein